MAEEKAAAPTGPTPGGKPAGGAPEARPAAARKKGWKTVSFARVHIQSSFNNTIVTITDERGEVLTWASGGSTGFKGTRKGTPFAAQMTSTKAARRAVELGVKQVAVYVSGPGPGRETAIRALQTAGLTVITIKDVTPLPHNGCRRPKARRV